MAQARELLVLDLGTRDYGEVHAQQLQLHGLRVDGLVPDVLILVEHPHVVTLGRRGRREEVFDPTLPVYEVERGGQATYHGPGQLVAYPIVRLDEAGWGVKQMVEAVGLSAAAALQGLGLDAQLGATKELVGVWVGRRKLASIGMAVRRGVSFHGVAVNLNTDLSYFARIAPCGMDASVMGSAQGLLGREVNVEAVKHAFTEDFAARLRATPRAASERDLISRLQC